MDESFFKVFCQFFNSLQNDNNSARSNLKAFAEGKLKMAEMVGFPLIEYKTLWVKEKMMDLFGHQNFCLFPIMHSNSYFFRVVKNL